MTMTEPAYFKAFKNLEMSRTASGVLTVRFWEELQALPAETVIRGSGSDMAPGAE